VERSISLCAVAAVVATLAATPAAAQPASDEWQVLVAPYLTLGATDGRRYQAVADNIYRFVPVDQPGPTDLLHGPK